MRYLLACLCFSLTLFAEVTKMTYSSVTDDRKLETVWTIDKKEKEILFKGENAEGVTTFKMTPDYVMQEFNYNAKNKNTTYTMTLTDHMVKAKGNYDGKEIGAEYSTEKMGWIQEFNFSLRPFLKSDKKEYKFIIINPYDLSSNKMAAKKKDIEELTINGKTYVAQKVVITLQGFKSMFWGADAWYDTKSFAMLKYEANEGPNTPTTTTTLVSNEK
jgi:hypothetical protein